MDLTPYLKLVAEKEASDLFLSAGATVKIKIEGVINSVGKTVLSSEMIEAAAFSIMDKRKKQQYVESMECDFATVLPGESTRFRVNAFRQRGNATMVIRRIPSKIPTVEELMLPTVLKDIITVKRGLVLMVGATGSGKSTTLAAMLNHRNQTQTGHILTIEDPIEFSHPNIKSLVNQREIGVDTLSYSAALKSSLREAPDVILIGEVRTRDTMEAAMELSNTGHLALSTLHANNANQTMERIINMFPQALHRQLYMDLSMNLRAIISQRLVRGVDGRRRAAMEIMLCTPYIAELILKGEIASIKQAMEESGQAGMQTFDQALYDLYISGDISLEEALSNADSKANLENRINFG